jgi:hypothetical protein
MGTLEPHCDYELDKALAALGLSVAAAECADWRIGEESAALLARFGEWPKQTHLTGGRTLRWKAPEPCSVVPPNAVRAKSTHGLHAFALRSEGRATYLGPMQVAYSWSHPVPGRSHGGSTHRLAHAVPPELWSSLDPMRSFPRLDDVLRLDRVVEHAARECSLDSVLAVISSVHAVSTDPVTPEPRGLAPALLCDFHRHVGRHQDVHSAQNRLVPLGELAEDADGHITFYVENQGVYLWSVRSDDAGVDPLVYGQFNGDEPWQAEMPLSRFLLSMLLSEYVMQAPYGGSSAFIDAATMKEIAGRLSRLDVPAWRFPSAGTALHVGGGVVAQIAPHAPHGDGFGIVVGCSRPEPLQWLGELIDDWDHCDF